MLPVYVGQRIVLLARKFWAHKGLETEGHRVGHGVDFWARSSHQDGA
jgi:hypothetical protein